MFAPTDIHLANRLLELMRHSRDMMKSWEQGVHDERHRIQRDLHDDVAARLLSLLHQTREPVISNVARGALRGLREVIHLLGDEGALLEDVLSDVEAESREQLGGTGVHLEWHSPAVLPATMLSSLQHINLKRITREAIANALKHASPENMIVHVTLGKDELHMRFANDGQISEPSTWIAGRGLNNIKFRVSQIPGTHKWIIEQKSGDKQYCVLDVHIPLSNHEEN